MDLISRVVTVVILIGAATAVADESDDLTGKVSPAYSTVQDPFAEQQNLGPITQTDVDTAKSKFANDPDRVIEELNRLHTQRAATRRAQGFSHVTRDPSARAVKFLEGSIPYVDDIPGISRPDYVKSHLTFRFMEMSDGTYVRYVEQNSDAVEAEIDRIIAEGGSEAEMLKEARDARLEYERKHGINTGASQ